MKWMCYPCLSSHQEKSQYSKRKTCWLSWFEYQKHNECPLSPGMAWLSYPDVVLPKQACDREVMCEADMAETVWFLLTTSAYPPQATGLSAAQPSLVPICKSNAERYKLLEIGPVWLPATDSEGVAKNTSQWPKNPKVNLICILD